MQSPRKSPDVSSTPRGIRSASFLTERSDARRAARPRTAHPTSRLKMTAESWQGQLKKPQHISTVREQVTFRERPWTAYSKIMSLQPLESTLTAIASGSLQSKKVSIPSGIQEAILQNVSPWSLVKKRQSNTHSLSTEHATMDAYQKETIPGSLPAEQGSRTETSSSQQRHARYFNEADTEIQAARFRPQTLSLDISDLASPISRTFASPQRLSASVQQHGSPSSPMRYLRASAPSIAPAKIDPATAQLAIDDQAAKIRASRRPEKRVMQYDLPNQQALLIADQSAQATRESVVLIALHARQHREKEIVRRRLLELYWKKGAIPAVKKDDARRALETDDIESARAIIEETEAALKEAARVRAMEEVAAFKESPQSPLRSRYLTWKPSSKQLLQLSASSKNLLSTTHLLDLETTSTTTAASSDPGAADATGFSEHLPEGAKHELSTEVLQTAENENSNTQSDDIPSAPCENPTAQSQQNADVERVQRLRRLQAAMGMDGEQRRKSSTPGSLQTEKITLQSRKLNEVPDVLLEKSTHVKSLSLRVNDLMSIPDKFCMRLLNLEEVDLSFNQLSSLPPTLGFLVNLCRLYVNENKLVGLPSSIGCLEKLESLNLDKNNLCKLPPAMSKLSSLSKLSLKGNRTFSLPPQHVVNNGVPDIMEYLSKVLEEGCESRAILWEQLDKRQIKVPALFLALDDKGGKKVDQETFESRMCWDLRFKMSKKALRRLWHLLDEDGDGFITHHEFLYQLRRPLGEDGQEATTARRSRE